jgi:serine/threonine-protein kinase
MIVARDGAPFVKILDFGISKFDAERTGSLKLTTEGLVMGTPYYMSPEQVRGSSTIDARTDIYALGVILYECACGVRPFEAAAIQHLAVLIHEGKPVPLAQRRPSLPPAFYDIVSRAMAADRELRFESARALAHALAPLRTRFAGASSASAMSAPYSRVVVDTSTGAPRVTAGPGATAPIGVMPSTNAALAATMGPELSGGARKRSLAFGMSALGLLLVAGGIGVAFMRSARTSTPPSPPVAAAAAPEPPAATALLAPSTALSAMPVEPARARPAVSAAPTLAVAPAAEGPRRAPPAMSTPPAPMASAAPSARSLVPAVASAPAPAPSASAAKSHVDDNGLSRDNPFR